MLLPCFNEAQACMTPMPVVLNASSCEQSLVSVCWQHVHPLTSISPESFRKWQLCTHTHTHTHTHTQSIAKCGWAVPSAHLRSPPCTHCDRLVFPRPCLFGLFSSPLSHTPSIALWAHLVFYFWHTLAEMSQRKHIRNTQVVFPNGDGKYISRHLGSTGIGRRLPDDISGQSLQQIRFQVSWFFPLRRTS